MQRQQKNESGEAILCIVLTILFPLGGVLALILTAIIGMGYILFWAYWLSLNQALDTLQAQVLASPKMTAYKIYSFGPGWRVSYNAAAKYLAWDIHGWVQSLFLEPIEDATQNIDDVERYLAYLIYLWVGILLCASAGVYAAYGIMSFILFLQTGLRLGVRALLQLLILLVLSLLQLLVLLIRSLHTLVYRRAPLPSLRTLVYRRAPLRSLRTFFSLSLRTFFSRRVPFINCVCPYCHNRAPIAVYQCPHCGTKHPRLWPSIYGVLYHRCKQCERLLPTLDILGRSEIHHECPRCSRKWHDGIGQAANVHIHVIGETAAGKTNFIVTATHALKELYPELYHYTISFPDEDQERKLDGYVHKLRRGEKLEKTPTDMVQAYYLQIQKSRPFVPSLIYFYDPSGETTNNEESMIEQKYIQYGHGCILVIDPCSMPNYYEQHREDIQKEENELSPAQPRNAKLVYELLVRTYKTLEVSKSEGKYLHSLAVVITKTDALGLEDEIGAPAAQRLMASDPTFSSEADAINHLVREFLQYYNPDNLVLSLEDSFADVRYFSCSSLGRSPVAGDSRPFTTMRVLEPLAWLLHETNVLSKYEPHRFRNVL